MDYTLKDKCPAPKTLLDIAEAGIADPNLATNAIAELLEQCYNQDKRHVLIALDGYNTWLKPTSYRSFSSIVCADCEFNNITSLGV